jgi:SAM-dependent methyltransferase
MTSMTSTAYRPVFYASHEQEARRSAEAVLPYVIGRLQPGSVVDVGCGAGVWLAGARDLGIADVLGIEGPWMEALPGRDTSLPMRFQNLDAPIVADRRFDLAIALEVAEHLKPQRAVGFVADLCALADIVLFSAAVPGQGGTHHINEQWQSAWVERFRQNDFVAFDVIRPEFWRDERVAFWYRQNTFLFAHERVAGRVASAFADVPPRLLDVVHPELFAASSDPGRVMRGLRGLVAWIGPALGGAARFLPSPRGRIL